MPATLPLKEMMFGGGPAPPAPVSTDSPSVIDPLWGKLAAWVDIYYELLHHGK